MSRELKRQIFIGDVQGCAGPLKHLLEGLNFDPTADSVRFAGDLVNRGGKSLKTLRFVRELGDSAMTVLGNHDLHLLAYAHRVRRAGRRNCEFDEIINAPDGAELLDWLIGQPLMWKSSSRQLAMVHAGVDPRWGPKRARKRAAEVEHALANDPETFFNHMYGDRPRRWRPRQPHHSRMRTITNVFTRMRFCDAEGRLELLAKGVPGKPPKGFRPWFEHLHPDWKGWTLVFGHWSMLGLHRSGGVLCLDSGCVWGNDLSALVIEPDGHQRLAALGCSNKRFRWVEP